MSNRPPLSQAEKERVYRGKQKGHTLPELAVEIACSPSCARKWWRVGRDKGLEGLRAPRGARGPTGVLSHFDPRIAEVALALKREHRRWGADRVLVELEGHPEMQGWPLPGRSRLAAFFKERCPECVAVRTPRERAPHRPPEASGVHEIWQLDSQEGLSLRSGEVATICNIRDPVGPSHVLAGEENGPRTSGENRARPLRRSPKAVDLPNRK